MSDELTEYEQQITHLVGRGIAEAMRGQDFDALRAWVAERTPAVLASFPAELAPADRSREEDVRRIVWALATSIWGMTPLPSNGYRPQPRPAPGRNDPCPCGSGEKHKRCCGGGHSPIPTFSPDEAHGVLATQASDQELESLLEDRSLPPDLLAALAGELKERDPEAAGDALDTWFDDPSKLDQRYEPAFETWLEIQAGRYGAQDFIELLLDMEDELSEELRPAAWRAVISPAIALRDIELAKEMLSLLHEATPGDPTLAPLEVTVLLAAGETRQAGDRARFWLGFLRRHGIEEAMAEAVTFLEATARDPERAASDFRASEQPFLAELATLMVDAVARPVRPLPVIVEEGEAAFEVPPDHLGMAAAWREAWPRSEEPGSADHDIDDAVMREPERWLGVLRAHPEAFDSLEVLDDLASLAWAAADIDRGWDEPLLAPLLTRGEAIVRASLVSAQVAALPWSQPANRPALRVLGLLASWQETRGRVEGGAALRTEILALDPADEQGHRGVLVDHALRRGDDARALELARAGDDLAQTVFGRGLALWRLGRREEAEQALRAAAADRPLLVRMLLSEEEPEKPEIEDGTVSVGGEDEAWLYRDEMLDVWKQTPDALEFLRGLDLPGLALRRRRGVRLRQQD